VWGICLRRVELESFVKSFLLFFIAMGSLAAMLYYSNYTKEEKNLDDLLYTQMRLCSFDLACKQFRIDFKETQKRLQYTLLRNQKALYANFPIPNSDQFVMELSYDIKNYHRDLSEIRRRLGVEFSGVLVLLALLSALFSMYALYPLRSALHLTREFVRDIIHDVNTPLSALRLNVGMLKRESSKNLQIERIEQSVENILNLQKNLRDYLDEHTLEAGRIELEVLIQERIEMVKKLYPGITFTAELEPLMLYADRSALERIVDNLLSNGAKYNRSGGNVNITIDARFARVKISDTGEGITDPKKVFRRFYTENAKGVGIGLHIVKKLCDMMQIDITIESIKGRGSVFTLDMAKLTHG